MHEAADARGSRAKLDQPNEAMVAARRRIECAPREDAVVFRCEVCGQEIRDLRGVFLAHGAGSSWRIECSGHLDAEHAMDAGHLFGGGLRSVELLADLARASWFDPAELFAAVVRLRAQSRGIYQWVDSR